MSNIEFEFSQGEKIYAHQSILLARCPSLLALCRSNQLHVYMEAIFNDSEIAFSPTKSQLQIKTVRVGKSNIRDAFLAFISFLYLDDMYSDANLTKDVFKLVQLFHFLESHFTKKESITNSQVNQLAHTFATTEISIANLSSRYISSLNDQQLLSFKSRISRLLYLCCVRLNLEIPREQASCLIGKHFGALFDNPDMLPDWTIEIHNKKHEVKEIHAHRVILACKVDLFSAMMTLNMEESSTARVQIDEFNATTMKTVMQYLYTGNSDLLNHTNLCDCFVAANYFGALELKRTCELYISELIDLDNVITLYKLSDFHGGHYLKERCISFIIANFEQVYMKSDYKKLSTAKRENLESRASNEGRTIPSNKTPVKPVTVEGIEEKREVKKNNFFFRWFSS